MTPMPRIRARSRLQAALSLFLTVTLTLATQAQVDVTKPRTVLLKRGQMLDLSLVRPLDSGHAQVGEDVVLKLTQPLMVDGATVLPADWVVRGQITKVTRAGKKCKSGRVDWKLKPLTMTDGKKIKIQFLRNHDYAVKQNGVYLDNQVALDTTGAKIGRAAESIALVPMVVLLSPLLIPMAIAVSGEGGCDGAMGEESVIPAGTAFYAAVSNDAQQSID